MSDRPSPFQDSNQDFTIGAVGHRKLEGSAEEIGNRISLVLRELLAEHPDEQVSLVCSIAEGADRLLLSSAIELGIPYDCVLPSTSDCFRADFQTQESCDQYERLLAGARTVTEPVGPIDREAGYLWASDNVLDRADTLVAVWDGGPGHGPAGTAETVARALSRGIPVVWVPSHPPYAVRKLAPVT